MEKNRRLLFILVIILVLAAIRVLGGGGSRRHHPPARHAASSPVPAKPNPSTPLHRAAEEGDLETAGKLLGAEAPAGNPGEKAADPNAVNGKGETPLILAAQKGHRDMAVLLIGHGADVNIREKEHGMSALNEATAVGNVEMVKTLVDARALIDSRSLESAATRGDTESLKYLVEKGLAELGGGEVKGSSCYAGGMSLKNTDNRCFERLLVCAAGKGHSETVDYLMKFTRPSAASLFAAVEGGCDDLAVHLVERGAPVKSFYVGPDGRSLMHLAAEKGSLTLMKTLVAKGGPVDVYKSSGETPLWYAVAGNRLDMATFLISQGASVNADSSAGTPLLAAVRAGNTDMVKLLVKSGADVNLRTRTQPVKKVGKRKNARYVKLPGDTPLMAAKDEDMKRLLRELGARE